MTRQRTRPTRRWPSLIVASAVGATLAACGGGSGDDDPFADGDINDDGVPDTAIGTPADNGGVQQYDINGDTLPDVDLGFGQFDVNGDGFEDRDVNGDGVVDDSVLDADGTFVGYETDALVEDRDGTADSDALGNPLDGGGSEPSFIEPSAANPCGSQPDGDPDSSNFVWADNCQVSAANQFARSRYSIGIQRVVWCAGFQGNSGAGTVQAFADGIFGANTADAVEGFQEARLGAGESDGVVGRNTWTALQEELELIEDRTIAAGNGSDVGYDAYGVPGERCEGQVLFYNAVGFVDGAADPRGWTLAEPIDSDQRGAFDIGNP